MSEKTFSYPPSVHRRAAADGGASRLARGGELAGVSDWRGCGPLAFGGHGRGCGVLSSLGRGGDEVLVGLGVGGVVIVGDERVDDGHFAADDVECGVERFGGFSERSSFEDACGGDTSPPGGPGVAVFEDDVESGVEESFDESSDASSDGSWSLAECLCDGGCGESVAVDAFDECAVGVACESCASDEVFGEFSRCSSPEVGRGLKVVLIKIDAK